MAATVNDYPLTKFYFSVDWGEGLMSFQEVSGLEVTREVQEYRGGLDPNFTKQIVPGMKTYGELTLKKGTYAGDNDLFAWWNSSGDERIPGMPGRRDLTISLKNAKHDSVMTWKIIRALPTKVTSTDLNAENNEIAIETIVLRHEGIEIQV